MGDVPPVSCHAMGGRLARTEEKWGNVYDHFATNFEWADGRKAFSQCRQMDDCFNQTNDMVYGTEGLAKILSFTIEKKGGYTWKFKGAKESMYVNEHIALLNSIRNGVPINNGEYMVNSTVMALMARDAAYTGKKIMWDKYMESEIVLGPKSYDEADYVPDPVAIPGKNGKRKIWGKIPVPKSKPPSKNAK